MDVSSWLPASREWQDPADQAAGQTLRLHLDNLTLRFELIDPDLLSERDKRLYAAIDVALYGRRGAVEVTSSESAVSAQDVPMVSLTWDDAFRIESQIGCLLRGDRLRQELSARLGWATTEGVPQAARLQDEHTSLLKGITDETIKEPDPVLRDFLLRVMEQVHWHSKRKYLARKVRGQATRKTLLLGLVALVLALWPYFLPLSGAQAPTQRVDFPLRLAAQGLGTAFSSYDLSSLFALYTSIAFGFLGALFSRLITLQRQWSAFALDELFNARSYHYIVLRASIGILGALIVFFFLQSGLVQGKVFPDFNALPINVPAEVSGKWPARLLLPSADLALLIMWSFLAGFSESLVPTVLSGTERQFVGALNPRQ